MGTTQEGLHSFKFSNSPTIVVMLYLSKAYDRVSWIYLKLLLIHIGFYLTIVKWGMACVSTASFAMLINEYAYDFFNPIRRWRQVFPLSHYIFLSCSEGA